MKIVIVSCVIFPRISPRSMRATELAKELVRQGHEVTLYAVLGKYDYSAFVERTGIRVKSLGSMRFTKQNSDGICSRTLTDRVLHRLLGTIFEFPDIELTWKTFNVLKGETSMDLLITVAVPYPIHWGAAWFRSRYPDRLAHTTWIADCGDPYMKNPFQNHPFYFQYVEKWFCRKADYLTVPIEEAKSAYYPEFRNKIRVIPQGFNFKEVQIGPYVKNEIPTFMYAGVFYENIRDPRSFLDYLSTLVRPFHFIVYTKSVALLSPYVSRMKNRLDVRDYIPRTKLLIEMSKADFLVNFENNTTMQSPSKLIDYALSGRPILSINSSKDLNKEKIDAFLDGNYSGRMECPDISQYDIVHVATNFLELKK